LKPINLENGIMDTQTVGQNNHNNHRPHRGNYNPRPQLDWEFDVDFVHGPITARVTVLRFEVPEYSVVVGMPRADGSIKPFVPYKAKTTDQLAQLEQLGSCFAVATDQAHQHIMTNMREAVEKHAEILKQRELPREKDQAEAAQRAQQERERKDRKKKNWTSNHEKRREENRQRARGGSGGGGKKKG
jgi:hypothetical protein